MIDLILLLAVAAPGAQDFEFRFIGNDGFEITDGSATILIDFPYHSGAFGYMAFDSVELSERDNALCVFTHRHNDHFDPGAIADIGCKVAGPPESRIRNQFSDAEIVLSHHVAGEERAVRSGCVVPKQGQSYTW